VAPNGFGFEFDGTTSVGDAAFFECAVIEFTAIEDDFVPCERLVLEDGHYSLTIGRPLARHFTPRAAVPQPSTNDTEHIAGVTYALPYNGP
jgi:hypothetical protein